MASTAPPPLPSRNTPNLPSLPPRKTGNQVNEGEKSHQIEVTKTEPPQLPSRQINAHTSSPSTTVPSLPPRTVSLSTSVSQNGNQNSSPPPPLPSASSSYYSSSQSSNATSNSSNQLKPALPSRSVQTTSTTSTTASEPSLPKLPPRSNPTTSSTSNKTSTASNSVGKTNFNEVNNPGLNPQTNRPVSTAVAPMGSSQKKPYAIDDSILNSRNGSRGSLKPSEFGAPSEQAGNSASQAAGLPPRNTPHYGSMRNSQIRDSESNGLQQKAWNGHQNSNSNFSKQAGLPPKKLPPSTNNVPSNSYGPPPTIPQSLVENSSSAPPPLPPSSAAPSYNNINQNNYNKVDSLYMNQQPSYSRNAHPQGWASPSPPAIPPSIQQQPPPPPPPSHIQQYYPLQPPPQQYQQAPPPQQPNMYTPSSSPAPPLPVSLPVMPAVVPPPNYNLPHMIATGAPVAPPQVSAVAVPKSNLAPPVKRPPSMSNAPKPQKQQPVKSKPVQRPVSSYPVKEISSSKTPEPRMPPSTSSALAVPSSSSSSRARSKSFDEGSSIKPNPPSASDSSYSAIPVPVLKHSSKVQENSEFDYKHRGGRKKLADDDDLQFANMVKDLTSDNVASGNYSVTVLSPMKQIEVIGEKEYSMMYPIEVRKGNSSWSINRRYKQFRHLDKELRNHKVYKIAGVTPTIPPKDIASSKTDPVLLEARRRGFQQFLNECCENETIANSSDFHLFIQPLQMGDVKPTKIS